MKHLFMFICFFLLVNTGIKAQKNTEEGQGGINSKTTTTTSNPFNNVKTSSNGLFSIDIPNYMSETYDLNNAASLQYKRNPALGEIYIFVIDDDKKAMGDGTYDIKSYFDFALVDIKNGITGNNSSEPKTKEINGLKTIQTEVTGKFGETGIFYLITIVESESHFYQILTWTIDGNKSRYEKDMLKMVDSFKQIKKK